MVTKSAGQTLRRPPTRISMGQHSGLRFEHPAHGYSRKPPSGPWVTSAKLGTVHEPVKMALPEKDETRAEVVGTTRPGSMLAMTEADPPAPELNEGRTDVRSVEEAVPAALALDRAARMAEVYLASQPMKLGRMTLTVLQMSPRILIAAANGRQDHQLYVPDVTFCICACTALRGQYALCWSSELHDFDTQQATFSLKSAVLQRHLRSVGPQDLLGSTDEIHPSCK